MLIQFNFLTKKKTTNYLETLLPFFKFQIMQNRFPVPTSQNESEAVLDQRTRRYLQGLVDDKLVVSSTFFYK